MNVKTILGSLVAGLSLFVFGFIYWALNPLPYQAFETLEDPAQTQAQIASLFPQSGMYFVPGPGNDPAMTELINTGPVALLSVDHNAVAGGDPAALLTGFVHNWVSALFLIVLLKSLHGLADRLRLAATVALLAVVVILGSEIIWWMQSPAWLLHHAIYYVIYFLLAAWVLHFFLPGKAPDDAHVT